MNESSPYKIDIVDKHTHCEVDASLLRKGICAALQRFSVPRALLSVAVVTDEEIADVQTKFAHTSGSTDVLAFDLSDEGSDGKLVEGDIVISGDTAMRCSRERGHHASAELALYAIHGTLHLLGMKDHNPDQAAEMHCIEDEILIELGSGPVYGG